MGRALVRQLVWGAGYLLASALLPLLAWPKLWARFEGPPLVPLVLFPVAGYFVVTLALSPLLRAAWAGPRWRVVWVGATVAAMAFAGQAYGFGHGRLGPSLELLGIGAFFGLPLAMVLLWAHALARGEARFGSRRESAVGE